MGKRRLAAASLLIVGLAVGIAFVFLAARGDFGPSGLAFAALVGLVLGWGLYLLLSSPHGTSSEALRAADRWPGLGTALVSGVLVALSIFALDLQARYREEEAFRAMTARDRRQQLLLTLTLEDDLSHVDLRGRDIRGALLRSKDLNSADLTGADLRRADLSDSNLVDADLSDAKLEGTQLRGVVWSTGTTWPPHWARDLRARSTIIDLDPQRDRLVRQRYRRYLPFLEQELRSGQTLRVVDVLQGSDCGWWPTRPVFRVAGRAGKGTPDITYPTFNSLVNTPSYGDERAFVDAKPTSMKGPGGFFDQLRVAPGDKIMVRAFVHNNANVPVDGSVPKAKDGAIRFLVPTGHYEALCISAFVSSSNTDPREIRDGVLLVSDQRVSLRFVQGSARLITNAHANGVGLRDAVVESGVPLGYSRLNGVVPGGYAYGAIASIRVRVLEGR